MKEIDIKFAIEFLKQMGYSWDGKIGKSKPETIADFDIPQVVMLNGEEKGLILLDEQSNDPTCILYWFEKHGGCYNFVTEKNLTKEWIEYLEKHNSKM